MADWKLGKYRILKELGEGGMGKVYLGLDEMLDRQIAIKMLRTELARDQSVLERFRSEAKTLAKLHHPSIATLFSFEREADEYFMVMEYVAGESVLDLLKRKGRIPWPETLRILTQALEGVAHAHRYGVVHRDLKPANIMLTADGYAKVMDFGIARVLGVGRLTRQGNVIGTAEYMPPEQIGGQDATFSSDVYSMGIVLYELMSGHVPFESPSEFEVMRAQMERPVPPLPAGDPSIPADLNSILAKALEKDPANRFDSAGAFRAALLSLDSGRPVPAVESDGPRATRLATAQEFAAGSVAPPATSTPAATRLATAQESAARSAAPVSAPTPAATRLATGPENVPPSFPQPLQRPSAKKRKPLFLFVAAGVLLAAVTSFVLLRPHAPSPKPGPGTDAVVIPPGPSEQPPPIVTIPPDEPKKPEPKKPEARKPEEKPQQPSEKKDSSSQIAKNTPPPPTTDPCQTPIRIPPGGPVSLDTLLALLQQFPPCQVRQYVEQRGVSFRLDNESQSALQRAGADAGFLDSVRQHQPAPPVNVPTPPQPAPAITKADPFPNAIPWEQFDDWVQKGQANSAISDRVRTRGIKFPVDRNVQEELVKFGKAPLIRVLQDQAAKQAQLAK